MSRRKLKILLIEDDEIDVLCLKRVLNKLNIITELVVAKDGIEGLELLRGGENGKERITPPRIILLDLNMPRMNGLEFLTEIRKDDYLKHSIVFVLTTSNSNEDKCKAYEKNIAGYILKSNIDDSIVDLITLLDLYWKNWSFLSESYN